MLTHYYENKRLSVLFPIIIISTIISLICNIEEIKEKSNFKKWLKKFQDNNMNFYDIFDADEFPNECRRLKFEMNSGKLFGEKYSSDAFRDLDCLKRIINNVNDINALGNAIFSQWRYFNHWSYSHPNEDDITSNET